MTWFKKREMNRKETNNKELLEEIADESSEKIPVVDKRKFNSKGERLENKEEDEKPKEPVKSAREVELENKLKEEISRREAAEAKLIGVQAKFEELKAQMERETQEMRERMRKTLEDRAKQSQFDFLKALLPVLDNLNLAIEHADKDSSLENLIEGVRGTARSFEQALISVGVEAIPSVGFDFNPELHEAIDIIETDAQSDGKITAEYSRGYKFGDRLLRPARVQVGKALTQKAGE
jgi:molecular chaperone GrpE